MEDDMDFYWADVSSVFGLTKLFGPALPPGAEISTKLQEKTVNYLKEDREMAVFVDDFVMDSYMIILNEEIVPTFWEHFSPKQDNMKGLTSSALLLVACMLM